MNLYLQCAHGNTINGDIFSMKLNTNHHGLVAWERFRLLSYTLIQTRAPYQLKCFPGIKQIKLWLIITLLFSLCNHNLPISLALNVPHSHLVPALSTAGTFSGWSDKSKSISVRSYGTDTEFDTSTSREDFIASECETSEMGPEFEGVLLLEEEKRES